MCIDLPPVYIVSDATGETAEWAVRAVASQFNCEDIEIKRFTNITKVSTIDKIIKQAADNHYLIVYTLVIEELETHLREKANEARVMCIDLLGPLINAFEQISDSKPNRESGLLRKIDEKYFRRIEAIEFAVRYDDGKDTRGIDLADIVLIGVSRTSKTPLSMYLAHKNIKVANVPMIPEVQPPERLFKQKRGKVVGLTIKADQLTHIRAKRLKTMGISGKSGYDDEARIQEELDCAYQVMKRVGCHIIDVTHRAIEETASIVTELYFRRLRNRGKR